MTINQADYTPAELIASGRAGTIAEAKRLIEIMRLEEVNAELLEALKELQEMFDGEADIDNEGRPNRAIRIDSIINQAISKAEGR